MSSGNRKRAVLHEKLQQLRAATHSRSENTTSIIVEATTYIEELKKRVETLNQEIGSSGTSSNQNLPMEVDVETLDKGGFRINVHSERNYPGLLVSILEAFEELGLDVSDARVSCTESFHLEAVGGEDQEKDGVDAQAVKQAVLQAIKNWSES